MSSGVTAPAVLTLETFVESAFFRRKEADGGRAQPAWARGGVWRRQAPGRGLQSTARRRRPPTRSLAHLPTSLHSIPGVAYLPAELTRLLTTIRDLDERAAALDDSIRTDVAACLAAPSQANRPAGTPQDPAVADLRAKITADQRLLVQWAEEKMSLATVAYDLLDRHAAELDVEAAALAAEMEADGSMAAIMQGEGGGAGLAAYDSVFGSGVLPPGLPGAPSLPPPTLGAPHLSGFPGGGGQGDPASAAAAHHQSAAAAAQAAAARAAQADARAKSDARRREREVAAVRAAQDAAQARAEAAAAAQAAALAHQAAAARDNAAAAAADAERRARAAAGAAGAGAGVGKPAAGTRRASAAVKAEDGVSFPPPPGALAAAPEEGGFPPALPGGGGDATAAGAGALPPGAPLPIPYAPAVPPGMRTSAPAPQAAGRLLTTADIAPSLKGRRAELFWPDDNLWYLIEVTDVDVAGRRAAATYVTGETEELDLAEIVREGHMSLITADLDL